jgi:cytochrome c oxidase assembly protein Cox11
VVYICDMSDTAHSNILQAKTAYEWIYRNKTFCFCYSFSKLTENKHFEEKLHGVDKKFIVLLGIKPIKNVWITYALQKLKIYKKF